MYLRDLVSSLVRRWYLLVAAVLIAAFAGIGVARVVGPAYTATGGVVLLPPPDPESPDTNRFLSLGSLKQATDVLVRSLNSDATHQAVTRAVPGADYTVETDATTSAPVLVINATASTPPGASAMLKTVVAQVPVNLGKLQGALDIAKTNQIVSEVLNTDQHPRFAMKRQLRPAVGVVGIVFSGLCVLIGALDAALLRRRERKTRIRAVRDDEVTGDMPDAPRAVGDLGRPIVSRGGGGRRP